jgi:inosine/xanthosine triphosphate pyrophosphatase family protein
MGLQILLATRNPWKVQLFAPVFAAHGFDVLTLADVPAAGPAPVENGATAVANALIKARHYHSPRYPWVFGDDAGLEVDALGGEPGVQTRRWNGRFTADVSDQQWLDYLLARLADVPDGQRTAAFVAGWALIEPSGDVHTRIVRAPFEIASQPIRPIAPGSPITAVRTVTAGGPANDLSRRQAEVRAEWQRWGILPRLLDRV